MFRDRSINTGTSARFRLTPVAGAHVVTDSLIFVDPRGTGLATAAVARDVRKRKAAPEGAALDSRTKPTA
jgi:hypothetical protein